MTVKMIVTAGLLVAGGLGVLASFAADRAPAGGRSATRPADPEAATMALLENLRKNQSQGMMNVPPEDGQFLRIMAQSIGAKRVVEIGTSNGYSGIWIGLALKATGGHLTTYDIDEGRSKLARENFKAAGMTDMVTMVLGDAHKELGKLEGPVDMVFIDADKEGYADYLKQMLPKLRPGGLILAHNTVSSGGQMGDFIEAIKTDPNLETVFLNPTDRGMSLSLKKR